MVAILEQAFEIASGFSEEQQAMMANHWIREMKQPDFIEIIRDEMGAIFFRIS
jgi:hypothetical protein